MLRCLILVTVGYRKGNVYDMDSFSRNNYVIVGSRTLHCEPPQVYQPTPDPPPPGRTTLTTDTHPCITPQPCVLNNSDSVCALPSCMEPSFRSPRASFPTSLPVDSDQNLHLPNLLHRPQKNQPLPLLHQVIKGLSLWLPNPYNQKAK